MLRKGRQVVCAVEDAALADLMCRRMPSTEEAPGRRIDLDLAADGEIVVSRQVDIGPSSYAILGAHGPALAVG